MGQIAGVVKIAFVAGWIAYGTIACRTSQVAERSLYSDDQIQAICEQFKSDNLEDQSLRARNVFPLSVVPNGETKKVRLIFEQLGLDPRRVRELEPGGVNMVRFYRWRISPKFALEIMVAT